MTRTKRSTNYTRFTYVQLCTIARQWQNQFATYSRMPSWKVVGNKTVAQHRVWIARELKKIARALRTKTVQLINIKIRTLKAQMAYRLNVKINSTKTSTAAVKRLKAKLNQIQRCARVSTLINLCCGVKFSSYKNPKVSSTARRTTARRRSYATRRRTAKRTSHGYRRSTGTTTAKYRKQAQTLKKEIRQLKQRNTFMKRAIAKFRNEVKRMRRHYNKLSHKPRLKVITNKNVGKQVSNIVRFSNALSNAFGRNRKVG